MKIAVYGQNGGIVGSEGYDILLDRIKGGGHTLCLWGRDFSSWKDFPDDISILLSLGGDGTFLRSLSIVRDRGVPIAGINFGHLGFLTTAKVIPGAPVPWIDEILSGDYETECRDLIKSELPDGLMPEDFYPYAANEISLQRQGPGMLSIDVSVDGLTLPTYHSDGIVISTPTGSTAYNLSIGGPIVVPGSAVLVITPIAPHNLNVRPLIVPISSDIRMNFTTRDGFALLMTDNRSVEVSSGTPVAVTKGEYGFKYISLHGNNFINALRAKLLWGEDRRNI